MRCTQPASQLVRPLTQQVELVDVQDAAVRLRQQARLEHRLALLHSGSRGDASMC